MFGKDRGSFGPPSSNNEVYHSADKLLELARSADARGNRYEAVHLYLAAFESASSANAGTFQPAIMGLRTAWDISCDLKDRSLAEHVLEKLEPYLSADEVANHAEALQRLALDKLEEFGFSREDLQDMANMVSEDFVNAAKDARSDSMVARLLSPSKEKASDKGVVPWPHPSREADKEDGEAGPRNPDEYNYDDLVGYDRAIERMHKRGIGLSREEGFAELLETLSRRHGIDSLPSFQTMLFRSYSREDANQFMRATAQELDVTGIRMFMEDTPLGYPVLLVMATSDFKMNPMRGGFGGPGVLLLENIDTWGAPFTNDFDEFDDVAPYAQFSRGARDAVLFIRSAVDNPDVTVMATCSSDAELDDFFLDLLDPIDVFDVETPNDQERLSVWNDVCALYPSLRPLGGEEVVRLSANLSRYDIYLAAREAVDQAYRASIEQRAYVPVTRDNLYNKIAAYQPLDSDEYRELEEAAVDSLRHDLEGFDDEPKGLG